MAISGNIQCSISITDTQTIGINATGKNVGVTASWILNINDGTGAGQGNKVYQAQRTLSGSSEELDLYGVLTSVLGATLNPSRIIAFGVRNLSTANTLTFGGAASNAWATCLNAAGEVTLRPATADSQSFAIFAAPDSTGWGVTNSTGDKLKVAGTSGQSYQIFFIGS